MTLAANEQWQGGFVVDTSTAPATIATTTAATGLAWWGGFIRDADGRLAINYDGTGASFADGFLRSPDGRLIVRDALAGEGVHVS